MVHGSLEYTRICLFYGEKPAVFTLSKWTEKKNDHPNLPASLAFSDTVAAPLGF